MSYFLVLFQSLCDLCCLNSVLVCKAFSIFCNVKGLAECQRNYGGNDERTGGEFISQTRQLGISRGRALHDLHNFAVAYKYTSD